MSNNHSDYDCEPPYLTKMVKEEATGNNNGNDEQSNEQLIYSNQANTVGYNLRSRWNNIENSHFNGDEIGLNWFLEDPSTNFLSNNQSTTGSTLAESNLENFLTNQYQIPWSSSNSSSPSIPLTPFSSYPNCSSSSGISSASSSQLYSQQSSSSEQLSPILSSSPHNLTSNSDSLQFNSFELPSYSINHTNVTPSPPLLPTNNLNPPPLKYFGDLVQNKDETKIDPVMEEPNRGQHGNHEIFNNNERSNFENNYQNKSQTRALCNLDLIGSSTASTSNRLGTNNDESNINTIGDQLVANCGVDNGENSDKSFINWKQPMPDSVNNNNLISYPFDHRIRAYCPNHSTNMPKTVGSGHFGSNNRSPLNYCQRPILPSIQPATTLPGYPFQRPLPIQPNSGYYQKISPRFISPYLTGHSAVNGQRDIILWSSSPSATSHSNRVYPSGLHPQSMGSLSSLGDAGYQSTLPASNRVPIMISTGRVAFTGPVIDDLPSIPSPSSTSPTSSSSPNSAVVVSSSPPVIDKKLILNNPLLVNMLTCPQIPGLRNLAPAPDSSSSSLDEKSKSEILSGLVDGIGERRKRPARNTGAASREPIKREMRPKIFDVEKFNIGMFHVQSSNQGSTTRRGSSTQLKVIFSKRRFIYEFAFPGNSRNVISSINKSSTATTISSTIITTITTSAAVPATTISNNNPVVYYVIAVPFETVTALNIDESTMYLTVDRAPFLFGGTPVRSKVLFEKAPRFDPSQGELESNGLHCIHLRASQVGRLRTSLIDFDKRFSNLLTVKINRDPVSYIHKLPEGSKDNEEDKPLLCDKSSSPALQATDSQSQPSKRLKSTKKIDNQEDLSQI